MSELTPRVDPQRLHAKHRHFQQKTFTHGQAPHVPRYRKLLQWFVGFF
jgi:hypothetical protein